MDATTAIWCSNRGMSEAELVELLQVGWKLKIHTENKILCV